MADVTEDVQATRARRGPVISGLPSLAEHWLVPALRGFSASQVMSSSTQINSDPRLHSETVELDQLEVQSRAGDGMLLQPV